MKEASPHKEGPTDVHWDGSGGGSLNMESKLASGGQQNGLWIGRWQRRMEGGILGKDQVKSDLEPGPFGTR